MNKTPNKGDWVKVSKRDDPNFRREGPVAEAFPTSGMADIIFDGERHTYRYFDLSPIDPPKQTEGPR